MHTLDLLWTEVNKVKEPSNLIAGYHRVACAMTFANNLIFPPMIVTMDSLTGQGSPLPEIQDLVYIKMSLVWLL